MQPITTMLQASFAVFIDGTVQMTLSSHRNRSMNFDINRNGRLFFDLLDLDIKILIQLGKPEAERRNKLAKLASEKKLMINFAKALGTKEPYLAYFVEISDPSLRSEVR